MALVHVAWAAALVAAVGATCVAVPEGKAGWEAISCKSHGGMLVSTQWCPPFNNVAAAIATVIADQEASFFGGHAITKIILVGDINCYGDLPTTAPSLCACRWVMEAPLNCSSSGCVDGPEFDLGNQSVHMRYEESDRLRAFSLSVFPLFSDVPPALVTAAAPAFVFDGRIGHFSLSNVDISVVGGEDNTACIGIDTYAQALPGRSSIDIRNVSCVGTDFFAKAAPSPDGGLFSRCRGSLKNTYIDGTLHVRQTSLQQYFSPGHVLGPDTPETWVELMPRWRENYADSLFGRAQCVQAAAVIGADVPGSWQFELIGAPSQWTIMGLRAVSPRSPVNYPPFVVKCDTHADCDDTVHGCLCANPDRALYCVPAFSVVPGEITAAFAIDMGTMIGGVRALALPSSEVVVALVAAAVLVLVIVAAMIARCIGHNTATAVIPQKEHRKNE